MSAFAKLKQSPSYQEVHDKICAGVAIERIAEWLQEEKGEFTNIKRPSLVRQLYRYKESIPATKLADAGLPSHLWKKIEGMKRGVNELEELEKLYLLQLQRIALGVDTEEKIKFLNKAIRKELELAADLLGRMAELKMKLGLYDEAPTKFHLTGEFTHREALEKLDPDQRRKLGEATQPLLEILRKKVAELVSQNSGSALPAGEEIQDAEYEVVG